MKRLRSQIRRGFGSTAYPGRPLAIMQLRRESILLLLLCIGLWAGQSVAAKVATNSLPPFQVMAVRFLIPIICLGLIAELSGTRCGCLAR